MKRFYSLDFLKLLFAYVIAYFHFGHTIAPGPTVTVQIFFFISGFFLARKFYARSFSDCGEGYSPWNYTLDHVKGLYPHYVFAFAAYFLYNTARAVGVFLSSPSWEPIRETALSLYDQIPNMLFLQSAYYFHDNMNYPTWQLSALVIGGYFVYALLCHNEKLSRRILFPAGILMILSLRHTGVDLSGNYGFFYIPLLRAFAGLSFGVLVYYFTTTVWYAAIREKRIWFNLAALLSLPCIFLFAEHGNIHFVTGALLILGCCEEDSWLNRILNHRCFRHCGKLSLSIYVNHALVCRFVNGWLIPHLEGWGFPLNQPGKDLLFFVILTISASAALWLVNAFLAHRARKTAV